MDPQTQTAVAGLLGMLPQPYSAYAADAVTVAAILFLASTRFCAYVPPPSAAAPNWWRVAYVVPSWIAGNFGWARNAVVPGAHRPVQEAMLVSTKLAEAAPELATIAEPPAIKGAVVPTAPQPSIADVIVAGTKPLAAIALLFTLSACTAPQATRTLATAEQVVADGQLVCQVGPTAFAMLDPSGAAILAKGAAKQAVDAVCGLVNGAAVALPDVSVQPAGLVVQLPPSVVVPLKG